MSNCRKCNGTGHIAHFAHSDGGRCWACTGKADTSYTRLAVPSTEEALEAFHAANRRRDAARRARRVLVAR